MTIYEHFMLSIVFGAVIGWLLAGVGIMTYTLLDFIVKKIKAHREKKLQQIEAAEAGGTDHDTANCE